MTTQGTFHGTDGAELYYRINEPESRPKAAVILIHGFGDHSGGLQNLSKSLVQNRYCVYALDLRGHGKSSGKRGFISSWDEFRGDLQELQRLVALERPTLPLFIVGHSMGGVITLDYALDHQTGISGAAVISPAISYKATPLEKFGITIMGKLKPDFSFTKKGNFHLHVKDPELQAKLNPEGLRHNTVTPGLGRGLLHAIDRVEEEAGNIQLPFLLQYGLDDRITPPEKLREFFSHVGSPDKRVYEYALAKHRPFDENGREVVLEDLTCWLDQQVEKAQRVSIKFAGRT
ncbi:alpha/beta hydrolase [Mesobacillus foraminis]|uniref:Alpha-beta hydrolase superfamily lysophospholipase n=1 Tax=Mesobacillus foraminis TaxID=279826 RepID=A0A4R2BJN6_9BACI|nr:alpha/beta hydrolase [Mesobacillus foraminis]TCN26299.1 alpha-beta hydrolase superfamily lysophospholipase [Mesobacillus foraminis]